ncbi:hypothetical protein [Polyangium sp. y55x31]|uniref:hypothetical protein n=1 Tax=Polyangium sp. y55x31 TaxID=3042688 RepID=UPI002482424C|nr:hypothetical protein [Polyangium sp. y55x31]MDI1480583.1 hypothetical protein [Polyangium sp. y55x31]
MSDDAISSSVEQCSNVPIPGLAIGSKEITPPAYLPGACEPSDGEPIGEKEDPEQAVTFCCRPPAA